MSVFTSTTMSVSTFTFQASLHPREDVGAFARAVGGLGGHWNLRAVERVHWYTGLAPRTGFQGPASQLG